LGLPNINAPPWIYRSTPLYFLFFPLPTQRPLIVLLSTEKVVGVFQKFSGFEKKYFA
jgi:hypothetical protein